MADVDISTLLMSIQAINEQIRKYQKVRVENRESELEDHELLEPLLVSYGRALHRLKQAYTSDWTPECNFPEYDKVIENRLS